MSPIRTPSTLKGHDVRLIGLREPRSLVRCCLLSGVGSCCRTVPQASLRLTSGATSWTGECWLLIARSSTSWLTSFQQSKPLQYSASCCHRVHPLKLPALSPAVSRSLKRRHRAPLPRHEMPARPPELLQLSSKACQTINLCPFRSVGV